MCIIVFNISMMPDHHLIRPGFILFHKGDLIRGEPLYKVLSLVRPLVIHRRVTITHLYCTLKSERSLSEKDTIMRRPLSSHLNKR